MRKHVVCIGDSNTHGACADPTDCADSGTRFNENERWTCLLQQLLGEEYLVLEEGLGGRTTVFTDPLHEAMSALDAAYPILMSHAPVDLAVIMLGTNDTKQRYSVNACCIAQGMNRLIDKMKTVPCWGDHEPRFLIICPPHIGEGMEHSRVAGLMGPGCIEKSRELGRWMEEIAKLQGCAYLDAEGVAEFNRIDYMHLTRKGHRALAEKLAQMIPEVV